MLESDVKIAADNCSTRVNEALDAAGVAQGGNSAIPGTAGMRLKCDGGLQGTPTVIEIPQNSTGFLSSDLKAIQQFEPTPKPSNIPPPGAPGGTPVITMPMKTKRPEEL